jgi:hypothetical protein
VLTLQVALAPAAGHIRKYVTKESFRTRTKLPKKEKEKAAVGRSVQSLSWFQPN